MGAYLTPERFRTMRHGADLSNLSDLDLVEVLEDATAVVDSYCTVPYGHSFLGGTVVNEQRPWHYPQTTFDTGSRRVFPKHWPIREISAFRIRVGAGASATLPVNDLVIDQSRRFVEVTSAAIVNASGLFGVAGWIVPFGGLQQPIAELDYSYGASIPETDRLWPVGDSDTIYQAPHGYWTDEEMELRVGDDIETSGYALDLEEGRVIFDDAPEATPIMLTYSHRLFREIPRATSIIAADLLGHSKLVSKGMAGLQSMQVGEIRIQRETVRQALGASLDTTLPRAAELLQGFKHWSAA